MGECQYQIRVEHSPAPGCDWTAWVGFKPMTEGFSVLASFSDGPARLTRIARSRSPLTWRTACKALLRTKEEWLLDTGLSSAELHGLQGWQADLLSPGRMDAINLVVGDELAAVLLLSGK